MPGGFGSTFPLTDTDTKERINWLRWRWIYRYIANIEMKKQHDKFIRHGLLMTIVIIALSLQFGCLATQRFRDAAGPALETGITNIVNGLLDGFFAVIATQPN